MQTWNSVCGEDGNPISRKLEGLTFSDTSSHQSVVSHTKGVVWALQVLLSLDLLYMSGPTKGGSWEEANPDN
jgi:hypothetical protein